MSYPIYLLHSRAGKDRIDWLSRELPVPVSIIIVSFGVLAAALLINVLIERRHASRMKRRLMDMPPSRARRSPPSVPASTTPGNKYAEP